MLRRLLASLVALGLIALPASAQVTTAPFQATIQQNASVVGKNPVTAGLTAEYPMNEGSGSTNYDISGNGNNASFCATAPTWTTWGVAINSTYTPVNACVQTPLTTFKTAIIHACNAILPTNSARVGGVPYQQFPVLLAPGNTTAGLMMLNTSSLSQKYLGAPIPSLYRVTGTLVTTTSQPIGPCYVEAVTLDTSDHIYINGVEQAYASQGASASYAATSGTTYYLGGANGASTLNPFSGSINYALFYSGVLTPAQVQQVSQYVQQKVAARPGYPGAFSQSSSTTPQLLCSGDSLTDGYQASASWCGASYVTGLSNTYNIAEYGIGGETAETAAVMGPVRVMAGIAPAAGRNIVHVWLGTNDFANSSRTAAQTWASLQQFGLALRAAGAKTIVATMISRTGQDTNKNTLNALIRAGWQNSFDALDDLAAIPAIGADGANANTSSPACFNGDNVHLNTLGAGTCYNSLAGYSVVAWNVARVVNIMDGATDSNPTVTTSNAYTQAIGDNVVLQTPTAAASTTLPDCTGLTGVKRKIINGSGSYSITVNTSASQTIAGGATIAANAAAVYQCMLTSNTAGGNSWLRVQ